MLNRLWGFIILTRRLIALKELIRVLDPEDAIVSCCGVIGTALRRSEGPSSTRFCTDHFGSYGI